MSRFWETPIFQKQTGLRFNETFFLLFCEKNSDGTKKLRLKGNELQQRFLERLTPPDMSFVCNFLKDHPKITQVDLSYNPIETEGLELLCNKILKYSNNIEELNLTHCQINEDGIKTFYDTSVEGTIKLKTLRLAGNPLGPIGGHFAAKSIPFIPSLEYFDIGDTNQTAESIEAVLAEVYFTSLQVLNISRPVAPTLYLQVDHTSIGNEISELLRINHSLVELHAQKCDLDAHCVESIIKGLTSNTSLKFLDLGYNNICCPGVEFLSEWLRTRPNLLGLNIAGNKVRNHGAVALSFGLPFSKVRYLNISYNQIEDKGMIDILKSIKKPYMLRYFMIWGNKFSHPSNKLIERMMRSKVFEQDGIDVKIYCVDGVLYAARYPVDNYKHRYYGVMDHGCAVELKIKRNRIEQPDDKPRALVNFKHVDRYPKVDLGKEEEKLDEARIALMKEMRGEKREEVEEVEEQEEEEEMSEFSTTTSQ